jgi:DNA polymerase-3 subunit gamma/tau
LSVSLYRKYRPLTFADVIGQDHVTRTLVNAIRQGRVSHAYLFSGPRGTGKTSTAKILAMALNCESGGGKATVQPDGTCPRCEAIRRGSSMDVLEIDAASNRGIDEIRELRDRVQFAPVEGRMKVYIVDEVHMLTPEAFNALLKMLEEPPPHVVFVLATTEPHRILPTILSRCQRFDFRRPAIVEIVKVLASVAQREGIDVSENTLSVIARAAGGSFRDAVGTLDQLSSYCDGAVTLQDALAILGVAEQDLLFELVDIADEKDSQAALLFVERLVQGGTDLNQFLKDVLGHLRDLYVVQHTVEPPASIGTSEEHLDGLRSQANRVSTGLLLDFIDLVGEAQRAVRQGADPRLELEVLLIKLTRPDTDLSLRGLAARLDGLEHGGLAPVTPLRESAERQTRSPSRPRPTTLSAVAPIPDDEGEAPSADAPPSEDAWSKDAEPEPPDAGHVEATLDNLKRAWPVILNAVKRSRPSLAAILAEGRPDSLEDDTLVVRFGHGQDFQATQLTRPDNSSFLTDALLQITNRQVHVVARVSGTPAEQPAQEDEGARILSTEELVQLLKQEFDARPIDGDDRDATF